MILKCPRAAFDSYIGRSPAAGARLRSLFMSSQESLLALIGAVRSVADGLCRRAAANLCEKQSLHLLQQLPASPTKRPESAFARRSVPVNSRAGARSGFPDAPDPGARVHAAARFAAHRRRAARAADGFCAQRGSPASAGIAGLIASWAVLHRLAFRAAFRHDQASRPSGHRHRGALGPLSEKDHARMLGDMPTMPCRP